MTVTQIISVTKSKSRVMIDNEPAFVLYKGELRLYGLAENVEINSETYAQITGELLPKRARLRALNLLKSKDYTVSEMRRKLKEGEYSDEVVENALEYALSYGYLDDLRYARGYLEDYGDRKSLKQMEMDLMRRGISKAVLEQAKEEWERQGGGTDESALIEELLRKRHFDKETSDLKEKQRTYAFLLRKGFSAELIRKMLHCQI